MPNYNELQYTVKYQNDPNSLNKAGKEADDVFGKVGQRRGASSKKKETIGGQKAEANDLIVVLDKLSRAYVTNSQKLVELRTQIDGYKNQLKGLAEAKKQDGQLSEESLRQEQAIQTALKDTQADYNKVRKDLITNQEANEALGTSYDQMRIRMKALSLEIRNIQDPLGRNAELVRAKTEEYNRLNTQLKTIDASMGNHQRNVGNYENALRGAANAVATFQGPLGPLAGRLNSLATVISRGRVGLDAFGKSANKTAFLLKGALVASGIGLVLIAIGSLIAFTNRTIEGQERLRVVTARLSAMFSIFGDTMSAIGKFLFDAFDNPREAISGLWSDIKNFASQVISPFSEDLENIRNRFVSVFTNPQEAFVDFIKLFVGQFVNRIEGYIGMVGALGRAITNIFTRDEKFADIFSDFRDSLGKTITGTENGFKDLEGFFTKVGESLEPITSRIGKAFDEATRRGDEAVRIQTELNALMVREEQLMVKRAKQNFEMAQARADSRDLEIDAQKRLEALIKVREAERLLIQEELSIQEDRLRLMQEEAALSDTTEETRKAIAEQQANVFRLQEESQKREMSFNRDLLGVRRQILEENLRMARFDADMASRRRALNINQQIQDMEFMGERLKAIELERAEWKQNLDIQEAERRNELLAEYERQNIKEVDAMRMAQSVINMEREEREAEFRNKLREAEREAYLENLSVQAQAFDSFSNALFGDSKATALANAIMNTYEGVSKAIAINPTRPIYAAIALANGLAQVRRIMAVKRQKGGGSGGADSSSGVSTSFGLVDTGTNDQALADATAGMLGAPNMNVEPTFIFEGDLDPEIMAIKVRRGNDAISGRSIGVGL